MTPHSDCCKADFLGPYVRDLTKVHLSKSECRRVLEELVAYTALRARDGAFKDLRKIVRREMVKWYQPNPCNNVLEAIDSELKEV